MLVHNYQLIRLTAFARSEEPRRFLSGREYSSLAIRVHAWGRRVHRVVVEQFQHMLTTLLVSRLRVYGKRRDRAQ